MNANIRGPPMFPSEDPYDILEWLEARNRLRRRIMFQCIDNKGQVLATYAHLSEAETYWNASVSGAEFDRQLANRDGEIVVFDAKGDEAGTIKLPKTAGAEPRKLERPRRGVSGESAGDKRESSGGGPTPGTGRDAGRSADVSSVRDPHDTGAE